MPDLVPDRGCERPCLGRVRPLVDPLPLGPEPVDVRVQQEEERITGGRVDRLDEALEEAHVRGAVRVALHRDERAVRRVRRRAAKRDRLRLVQDGRCRVGERGSPHDPQLTVGAPGPEWVSGGELKPAGGVRDADEAPGKQVRRRTVEPPVRQRHARIDRLQLALEIEQVGAVPGEEAHVSVRLRGRGVQVHLTEVAEAAAATAVQRSERSEEPVALCRCERLGVLADPNRDRLAAENPKAAGSTSLDRGVAERDARTAELPRDKEPHRRTADRQIQPEGRCP